MNWQTLLALIFCLGLCLELSYCRKRGKHGRKSRKNLPPSKSSLMEHTNPHPLPNITLVIQKNRHLLNAIGPLYKIVTPVQVRKSKVSAIDTRDMRKGPNRHYSHTSIVLDIEGVKYKIKLSLNKNLLSDTFIQKHYLTDDTQVISKNVEHCYYHGQVRKIPDSMVAVSTCHGLTGVIRLHNDTYIIQPLVNRQTGTAQVHVIYKTAPSKDKTCGNQSGLWQSYQQLYTAEFLQRRKLMLLREKRKVTEEVKYIELALVFDYSMYLQKNSSLAKINSYALQVANIIDMYYKQLNTRVALVFVEVWNEGDPMRISSSARETLHGFLKIKNIRLKNIRHDVAHLITARTFDNDQVGMAIPDSICTARAVGVNEDPSPNEPHKVASVVAHMIGHNIGLSHDEEDEECTCMGGHNCLMKENVFDVDGLAPESFSECSIRNYHLALGTGLGYCLFSDPEALKNIPLLYWEHSSYYQQHCGNGNVERGEECDCGPEGVCNDPCCDPATCLLKPWARCTTGPCCHNCTVLTSTHQCREAVSQCDVPEFCNGVSGACPQNAFIQDGQPCLGGAGYCYQGRCPILNDQCRNIWGQDAKTANELCYVTFNPTGNLMGHCGKDAKGKFVPCEDEHVRCGLLHCSGGSNIPLQGADRLPYTKTTHTSGGLMFECKIANGQISPDVTETGMVMDGTRCGRDHMCLYQACVNVAKVFTDTSCPRGGAKNETCSGNGVCTTLSKCFCNDLWEGSDCSVKRNFTSTQTPPVLIVHTEAAPTGPLSSLPPTIGNVSANADPVVGGIGTMWLIIILAAVIGIVVMVLAFTALCYRRKSPIKSTKLKSGLFSGKKPLSHEESSEDGTVRSIKFGNMPSYRYDKRNGHSKGRSRARRKDRESGSDEESTSNHVEPEVDNRPEVKIPEELSRVPERGILKNSSRFQDDDSAECSCDELHGDASDVENDVDIVKDFVGKRKVRSREHVDSPTYRDFKDLSQYSSLEDVAPPGISNTNQAKPVDLSKLRSSSPGKETQLIKLRSIDDLITKIDSQSLSPDVISPANSDEMKYSETEVDHDYQNGAGPLVHQPSSEHYAPSDNVDSANESGFDTGCEQNTVTSVSVDDIPLETYTAPSCYYPLSPGVHKASTGTAFQPYSQHYIDDTGDGDGSHKMSPSRFRHVSPAVKSPNYFNGHVNEDARLSKSPDRLVHIKRPPSPTKYSFSDGSDGESYRPSSQSGFPSQSFRPQPRSTLFNNSLENGGKNVAKSSYNPHHNCSDGEDFAKSDDGSCSPVGDTDSIDFAKNRTDRVPYSKVGRGDTPVREPSGDEDHIRRNSYILATDGAVEV